MGLLADLYAPSLPWRLVVDDGVAWDIGDTFLNSVKEVSNHLLLFFVSFYLTRFCLSFGFIYA